MREALAALTTRGRAFLAAGATIAVCAFVLGFGSLMRVGILALALPLLTAAVVGRARYRLMATRVISPARVSAGQPATVTLQLANDGSMPMGLLLLEDRVPYVLGTRARFLLDHAGPRWHQDVSYTIRSEIRGRYEIGPLSIRVSDPFGLIELVRSFTSTTTMVVTPQVHLLPSLGAAGEWTGAGENRPRAFAVGSAEDVTVREYRRGDDLRRVHWPSTARIGELMVRREEQPWQSRVTIVLDTRSTAHRGTGPASSLEWAISMAASVAVHYAQAGYAVRLVTDRPGVEAAAWHDRSLSAVGQAAPILEQLAVLTESTGSSLSNAVDPLAGQTGLVVAVLGALRDADLADLSRVPVHGSRVLGIVIDTSQWGPASVPLRAPGRSRTAPAPAPVNRLAMMLGSNGWVATAASPSDSPAAVWGRLTALSAHRGAGTPAPTAEQQAAAVAQSAGGRQ